MNPAQVRRTTNNNEMNISSRMDESLGIQPVSADAAPAMKPGFTEGQDSGIDGLLVGILNMKKTFEEDVGINVDEVYSQQDAVNRLKAMKDNNAGQYKFIFIDLDDNFIFTTFFQSLKEMDLDIPIFFCQTSPTEDTKKKIEEHKSKLIEKPLNTQLVKDAFKSFADYF